MIVAPCTGCNLNSNLITQKCTIFIPINLATKFFGKVNLQNNQLNLNANYLDLLYSIAIRHPSQIPDSTNISIPTTLIPPIFSSYTLTDTLQSIADYNYNQSELHFYTDGSVIQFGTSQCSMGIGWALIEHNNIIHTFQAQTKFWPCSFKAELIAILSAIITVPRNCMVHIYTDSQSVISKYNNLNLISLSLSFINTPYHSLWYTFINFIKSYNIQLTFHKVTAHQDNEFNNLADRLARNHHNLPYLIFNTQNYYNHNYTLQLDNYPIELPIRRCIRTICYAHIYALWTSQNRFQKWSQITTQIDWKSTWLYINNNQKISNYSHSFQTSSLKSFHVKILSDDLPSPHNLYKRNHAQSPNCHQCNQISTSLHWVFCPFSQPLDNLIHNSLEQTINSSTLEASPDTILNLYDQLNNLSCMSVHNEPDSPSLLSTLSGLVPYEMINLIKDITLSKKIATTLSIKFLLHLNQQIYLKTWIPYCIARSQLHSQIPPTIIDSNNFSSQQSLSPTAIPKIETWYPKWIKYQISLLTIITNSEI